MYWPHDGRTKKYSRLAIPREAYSQEMAEWTFFTNHAHVLLCIARDPCSRIRDMATAVGITERATQAIVADLVDSGYLARERIGRRNRYKIHIELPLRHPLEANSVIGDLLHILADGARSVAQGSDVAASAERVQPAR